MRQKRLRSRSRRVSAERYAGVLIGVYFASRQGRTRAGRHHTALTNMTDSARAAALAELAKRLVQLTTAAERRAYPMLEHLTDLIDDLEERE